MDPITTFGLVTQVADLLQRAFLYGKAVREAHGDMAKLSSELLSLKGTLEQLRTLAVQDTSVDEPLRTMLCSAEFEDKVVSTLGIVKRLMESLNKKQTSSRRINAALWPWVKEYVRSDIADLEKAKTWFITMMIVENLNEMKALLNESHQIFVMVSEDHEAIRREKIKRWLEPVDPIRSYEKANEKRMETTGSWLIEGKFKEWSEGANGIPRILWFRGKSGSGKTILHSTAVEELRLQCSGDSTAAHAFYYCSFSDRKSQERASVLGSVLYQLSEQNPDIRGELDQIRNTGENLFPTKICEKIKEHTSNFKKFFILVDAINESYDCIYLLRQLLQLVLESNCIRLFVTSISSYTSLLDELEMTNKPAITEVSMSNEDVTKEIEHYIAAKMEKARPLSQLSPTSKNELCQKLLQNADQMFRYVQCQLDYLLKLRTPRDVQRSLYKFPGDLDAIYTTILLSIPDADRHLAQSALFLLCVALRPLTLPELAEAAVFNDRDSTIDETMRLPDSGVLINICQGLIEHDTVSNTVTLAHSSVRTFLASNHPKESQIAWFCYSIPGIHGTTTAKCLTYLLFDDFKTGYCSKSILRDKLAQFPFPKYAAQYWSLHAHLSDKDLWWNNLFMNFCLSHSLPEGGNFTFWVQQLIPDASESQIKKTKPLYYAASYGLTGLVRSMLTSKTVDIDAPGGRFNSSALHAAVYRGHTGIVRILLDHGADPNALDGAGATPLFWAEKLGLTGIIALLQDPKYANDKPRVKKLVQLLPNFDYPMWFCSRCKSGPNRGRFSNCWTCEHERCDDCFKVAGMDAAHDVPRPNIRWMCCACGAGPRKMEVKACEDCNNERCYRCWTLDVSSSGEMTSGKAQTL